MTRALAISIGAAEARAALLEYDEVVRLFFADDGGAQAGEIRDGKVVRMAPTLNGAFVDIGDDRDAFLALTKSGPRPVEGARARVIVTREAEGEKGAIVSLTGNAPPARALSPAEKILLAAAPYDPREIFTDQPSAISGGRYDPHFVARARIEDAIAEALQREAALARGGRLVIDETEALVAVDVDSGAIGSMAGSAADETNLFAVKALFRTLALRGCGGRIIVDFLPSASAKARASLLEACRRIDSSLFPRRVGRLAPDGLCDFTAPRRGPSILARATESHEGEALVRCRRLTLDWRVKRATAALEDWLSASPSARMAFSAREDVIAEMQRRGIPDRIAARFGERFQISTSASGVSVHVL